MILLLLPTEVADVYGLLEFFEGIMPPDQFGRLLDILGRHVDELTTEVARPEPALAAYREACRADFAN